METKLDFLQVRVLHDCIADENDELTIHVGETLKVIAKDSIPGSLTGLNDQGDQGLVPETHLEDVFECSVCNNTYDGGQNRPISLLCGHGFCSLCIELCIAQGNKSCPVCRVWHGANSANKLPVNFLLEELIHKATISTSQKHESDLVPEKKSIEICPKHLGVPIHFLCRTHNVKVCHSCTVLAHKSSSCDLISLEDLMKEKKEAQIINFQEQIQSIMNTEQDLKALHQNNVDAVNKEISKKQALEKEVELLLTKIEQSNQEILKKQKPQEQIWDAIQSCQKNKESLKSQNDKLRAALNNKSVTQECQLSTNEIKKSQKWEETLRKELNLNVEKYVQVKRNGILRCSKVQSEGGKTIIPNLSYKVKPPASAKLIQEDELNLTSATTTAFLDISAQGCKLGRVYIRVLANKPRGQQFIMLVLGTNGKTLKKANFTCKDAKCISLCNYVTESNSTDVDLLFPIESEVKENISRGSLYRWGNNVAGFQIKINNSKKATGAGYFGSVITGLEVIDRAASDEFAIKDITISECGIILGY